MTDDAFSLETARLRLRELRIEDLEPLFGILGDAETMRYYPAPFSRDRVRDWISDNRERYERDGFGLWAIEDRGSGQFLGNCGPALREVEGVSEPELGWMVTRLRWNQGIATEAASACRFHAFGELGLSRLVSLVRPINLPSARVAEKIGMHVEREVEYHGFPHLLYVINASG